MTRREQPATRDQLSPVTASPLWGLVLVLGEIAERVERRRAEEQAPELRDRDTRRLPRQQGDT